MDHYIHAFGHSAFGVSPSEELAHVKWTRQLHSKQSAWRMSFSNPVCGGALSDDRLEREHEQDDKANRVERQDN